MSNVIRIPLRRSSSTPGRSEKQRNEEQYRFVLENAENGERVEVSLAQLFSVQFDESNEVLVRSIRGNTLTLRYRPSK